MTDETLKSAVEALMRRDAPVAEQKPTEANNEQNTEEIAEEGNAEETTGIEGLENLEEEPQEEEPRFEVEWKGEKKEVPLTELQKGYIEYLKGEKRQSDYTSKFQAVAEKESAAT